MTANQFRDYLKISRSSELSGRDKFIYRFFEVFPGLIAWLTLAGIVYFSWRYPIGIAFFIIAFDVYWLLKTFFLSFHLRSSYRQMKKNLAVNWQEKLNQLTISNKQLAINNWHDIYHLVILPTYKEGIEIVFPTLKALADCNYSKGRLIVVLALEERAGQSYKEMAENLFQEFKEKFFIFLVTNHPKDIPGELAGKGANEAWAAKRAKEKIIDNLEIPYENIIVSSFDIDTRVLPDFFHCITYYYLTCDDPIHSSFQPVPMYSNNIWHVPFLSRVVASSATFWHMMQQERPERMATFSSHSMSFKALEEQGFWQTNVVSEDSRIFWSSLLFYDGNYNVVPLYYPVLMDAVVGNNFWKTAANQYRQQRRWGYGVENIPYILFGFLKNKKISLYRKIYFSFNQIEGFWSWSTNALFIFLLGWLPLLLGGERFNTTLLAYNLPVITRTLMSLAMMGLVSSAILSTILLPPRPREYGRWKFLPMVLQWILLPFTIVIFGSVPGLEAQTRLMLGKYMGFWVTEKK